MIDTIKISHRYMQMPNPKDLQSLGWRDNYDKRGNFTSWIYKETGNFPYLTFFTAKDRFVYLTAEVSLPSFIFGSNARLLNQDEVSKALERLSEYVSEKSGVDFNAKTANVWKVHFTKDYQIGVNVIRQAISKLSFLIIPRFNKSRYDITTLYFQSKGISKKHQKPRTICIYSKQHECKSKSFSEIDIQQTAGIVRLEFRFNTTNAVKRFFQSNRQSQVVFTEAVSNNVLKPIENQILIVLENIDSSENIYETLLKKYSKRRLPKLIQFLYLFDSYGTDFYKKETLGFSQSDYYNCLKDCRSTGIYSLSKILNSEIQMSNVS